MFERLCGNKVKNRFTESIKYISNSLMKISEEKNGKIIGITSSLSERNAKFDICMKICEQISISGKSVLLIDTDKCLDCSDSISDKFSTKICDKGIPDDKLSSIINKEIDEKDIIILNIPCVAEIADAVEYAKLCKSLVLLEKYRHSTYKNYEEALIRLKLHGIKVDGVIAYS